jgi:hypothetical protein
VQIPAKKKAGIRVNRGGVWVLAIASRGRGITEVTKDQKTDQGRVVKVRQRAIGRELRRMYDDVAREPVPDEFLDLLKKIDEADKSGGGKS